MEQACTLNKSKKPPSREQVYCSICGKANQKRFLGRHFSRKHGDAKATSVSFAEAERIRLRYERDKVTRRIQRKKSNPLKSKSTSTSKIFCHRQLFKSDSFSLMSFRLQLQGSGLVHWTAEALIVFLRQEVFAKMRVKLNRMNVELEDGPYRGIKMPILCQIR